MSKIIDFFKTITASSEAEISQEEEILNDENLSNEEKQELIKTLKDTDTIAHKLWANNLKVAKNVKLSKNEEKADLKVNSNSIKVTPKGRIKKEEMEQEQ